jgi:hypothetical protein
MALMSGTRVFLLSTLLLAGGLAGCETVTTAPADSRLAGSWNLDKAASDNPEAKIAAAMSVAQARMKHRLARYGPADPDNTRAAAAGDAPDSPDYTYDTPEDYRYGIPGRVGPDYRGFRSQLRQELVPPNSLQLDVAGDLVTISSDQLPPRDYRLGERVSRIDEYGTAIISVSWSHDMFALNYKYTSHASHSETYQVDPGTGALTVTEDITDPIVGRITLHSVYRRGAPANS